MPFLVRETRPLAILYLTLTLYSTPLAMTLLGLCMIHLILSLSHNTGKKHTTSTTSSSSFFSIDLEIIALGCICHWLVHLGLNHVAWLFALRMVYVLVMDEGEDEKVKRYKVYPDWKDGRRWHYVDVGEVVGWKGWWDAEGGYHRLK